MPRPKTGPPGPSPPASPVHSAGGGNAVRRAAWLPHLLTLFFYGGLSLIVTYLLVRHFATGAMSEHPLDTAQNTWNAWWVGVALLDRHTNPFHTDLLLSPGGADLYFHTLNLPSTLLTLAPLRAWGPIAAYNSSVLLAFTLSGYAGFRLVRYVHGSVLAGLVGGLIIGFNPLMLAMSRGHIQVISAEWAVVCCECYLRAWAGGGRRAAIGTGLFFALALLTVGYFEVQLLLFFAAHLLWAVATGWGTLAERLRHLAGRAGPLVVWGGGTAVALLAPYLLAAWQSLQHAQTVLVGAYNEENAITDSLDLLGLILPNRQHWLLGGAAPWWPAINPAIHDYSAIGLLTGGLAALGVWTGRRQAHTWLWVAVAGLGVALALGPVLHLNNQPIGVGDELPGPFAALQAVPLFGLVRSPERLMRLTYLALAILAGAGAIWLSARLTPARRPLTALVIVAGLVLELPWHSRRIEPLTPAPSLAALGTQPAPGAVLELPLTQHGWIDTPRMVNQLAHGRPITSGYLSRPVVDPYLQACSPLQVFSHGPAPPPADIITPTLVTGDIPGLLVANGFGFIAVYKGRLINLYDTQPWPAPQLTAWQKLAASLGTPLADDPAATTYRLHAAGATPSLFLQLGPIWHAIEQSYGQPFRWLDGDHADLCVVSPQPHTAALHGMAVSFAVPRRVQVWVGDRLVYTAEVPADGALHALQTPPLAWPAGPQAVRLVVPEGSDSPARRGSASDPRQLSLGFSRIGLDEQNP